MKTTALYNSLDSKSTVLPVSDAMVEDDPSLPHLPHYTSLPHPSLYVKVLADA